MILGQKLEFSQKPYQLYPPREKSSENCLNTDQVHTCEVEIENLLKKGAIVPSDHEEGEFISPISQTQNLMGHRE